MDVNDLLQNVAVQNTFISLLSLLAVFTLYKTVKLLLDIRKDK